MGVEDPETDFGFAQCQPPTRKYICTAICPTAQLESVRTLNTHQRKQKVFIAAVVNPAERETEKSEMEFEINTRLGNGQL
jgi:hypothetical protein